MTFNWFIRATTKAGVKFVKEYTEVQAILVFQNMFESAEKGVYPDSDLIPETWKREVFPAFMVGSGAVDLLELCQKLEDGRLIIFNRMWIEYVGEGRFKVKTDVPAGLSYTHRGYRPSKTPGEFFTITWDEEFQQDEMSADWHMGFWDEKTVKRHEAIHAEVLKWRDHVKENPSDGPIIFDPQLTFSITDGGDEVASDLAPKGADPFILHGAAISHTIKGGEIKNIDFYSAPSIEPEYVIFVNGNSIPDLFVTDISFMQQLSEVSQMIRKPNINMIQGHREMPQPLFDALVHFIEYRNTKIGAHPLNAGYLEDGNDADYSIFWDAEGESVLYISPLADDTDFLRFDDNELLNP